MRRLLAGSLMAVAAAFLAGSLATALAADEPAKDVGTVTGKVVDADGKAVKGATVTATTPRDPNAGRPTTRPAPVAETTTGEDGTFKLEKVPVGKWTIGARLQGTGNGRTADPVEVKANEETKIADPIKLQAGRGGGGGGRGGQGGGGQGGGGQGGGAKGGDAAK